MTEIRRDPLSGDLVIIAVERAMRPENFSRKTITKLKSADCPFCLGNEEMTPPEVYALRDDGQEPNSPGWKIRVVPNLYPAFRLDSKEPRNYQNDLFKSHNGQGVHEVIIHSPDHDGHLANLNLEQIERIIKTYLNRYKDVSKAEPVKYISIIINHGKEAGASLEHPHSQLFAMPFVPALIERELVNMLNYRQENDNCLLCQMRADELAMNERIIFQGDFFTVINPFAASVPFETMIIPNNHSSTIINLSVEEIKELARILKKLFGKFKNLLENPSYNLYIHNSPPYGNYDYFHWHIIIRPKLTIPAGFEMSTDVMINIMKPEDSAKFLK